MLSQANEGGQDPAHGQTLLEFTKTRCSALEAELSHTRQELAGVDARMDQLGATLGAVRHEARRLHLQVDDLIKSGQSARTQADDLRASVAHRDATIAQLTDLLKQRDDELALALACGGTTHAVVTPGSFDHGAADQANADRKKIISLERRLRNLEEDYALQRSLSNLLLEMLQVLASPGKWWNAILPGAWSRRQKADRLRRKGLFDAQLYKKRNPDVGRAGLNPLHHYVSHGIQEGRSRT